MMTKKNYTTKISKKLIKKEIRERINRMIRKSALKKKKNKIRHRLRPIVKKNQTNLFQKKMLIPKMIRILNLNQMKTKRMKIEGL